MSTSQRARIRFSIPDSVQETKYRLRWSLQHATDGNMSIHLDESQHQVEVQDGNEPNEKIAVVNRASLAQFSDGSAVELKVSPRCPSWE